MVDVLGGQLIRVYRNKNLAVTDVAMSPEGIGFAAGFEPVGRLATSPVPGKVQVIESDSGLNRWYNLDVDYRAVARRVHLAVVDRNQMWIATDTGMILRLSR